MKNWYYQYAVMIWLAVGLLTFTISLWWPWMVLLPAANMVWVHHRHWHNHPRVGAGMIWLAAVSLGALIALAT